MEPYEDQWGAVRRVIKSRCEARTYYPRFWFLIISAVRWHPATRPHYGAATQRKVDWVRQGTGGRFEEIEFEVGIDVHLLYLHTAEPIVQA